jgi:hypothetical protein
MAAASGAAGELAQALRLAENLRDRKVLLVVSALSRLVSGPSGS